MRRLTYVWVCLMLTLSLSAQKQIQRDRLQAGPKVNDIAFGVAQDSKAILKIFNYDNNEIESGLGASSAHTLGGFMIVPKENLVDYVGETLEVLRYGIDNETIISSANLVIYENSFDETPVINQALTVSNIISGWNTTYLTESYKIPADKDLLIGLNITTNAGGYTLTFDTDPASEPELSGQLLFNGDYYGTLVYDVGIDADFNLQAIVTDGEGLSELTDLTITKIEAKTTECQLSETENVYVTLYNQGEGKINEKFNLTVEINDHPVTQQVSPTGFDSDTEFVVEIGSWDLSVFGIYDVSATFDFEDAFTNNNVFETFLSSGDAIITVELLTDAYPSETSWFLFDENENIIAQNGTLAVETQYTTEVCVNSSGCYTWKIFDSYGDGIMGYNSPAGNFTIYLNGEEIAASPAGGNFGSEFFVYGLGDGCAENEIELTKLSIPEMAPINTDIEVGGTVTNFGTANLTAFDVTYNLDGGTNVAVYTVTGIDIPIGSSTTFKHDVKLSFDATGSHVINVKVSNPNGVADDESNNDASADISIYEGGMQRTVLVEEFSTEKCPNCPPVATYLSEIANDNENVILMVHHAGYYTDDFTIPENTEMLVFFNEGGGTFAPAGMMDRHYNGLDNDEYDGVDPGPVFWPGEPYGETKIDERLNQPAFVDVNFEGDFNATTGELTVTVSGSFFTNFTNNLGVSLWIIEDGITTTTQAGFTGEWIHHALVRDAISGTFGTPITTSTNENDTYSVQFTYTVNSEWVVDNLSLVGFVNTIDGTNVNNRTVHNAGSITLNELSGASDMVNLTFEVNMAEAIDAEVFVPATDVLFVTGSFNGWDEPGTAESLELTDTDGDKVYSVTVPIAKNFGEVQYKYFNNAGWDGGEWTGDPNRIITVAELDLTTDDVWNNAVAENLLSTVQLFPNPFTNLLTISGLENASSIIISNVLGQHVISILVDEVSETISTANLRNGVYIITIVDKYNNTRTERIVKQ